MISRKIKAVIKRELRVKLGRNFVIGTIFIPLIMAAIVAVQAVLTNLKSENKADVTLVVDGAPGILEQLKKDLDQADFVKSQLYTMHYELMNREGVDKFLAEHKKELIGDDGKSVFFIPATAAQDKKVLMYSSNPANAAVRTKIAAAINKALNLNFFAVNNIQNVDIKFIQTDAQITGNKVSESGTKTESYGPVTVGGSLALLLLLGITFNAMPVMNVITGEKANRVYEILLSSLKPNDILWGKIIGTALAATLQMLVWVAALVALVLMLNNFVSTTDAFTMDFQPFVMAYYLVNYMVGLLIFLTLYGGLSSMYDSAGAAGTSLMPIYFIILLPFYTVFSLVSNPANRVAEILSMIPLTSLYVMPARMTLISVPVWQPILALSLNLCVLYFVNYVASKIYRVSVLATGNRPSLRQIAIWVKNN